MFIINSYKTGIYPPLNYKGEFILHRKEIIEGFIKKNLSFIEHIQLANFKIKEAEISYFVEDDETWKPLENFSYKDKQNILNQYNKAVYDLNDFFQNTEIESRELENWQTILELAFNPSYNIIYSNNNNKILLIWGCDFFNKQENYLKREDLVFDDFNKETFENIQVEPHKVKEPEPEIQSIPIEKKIENINPQGFKNQITSYQKEYLLVGSKKQNTRSWSSRLFSGIKDFLFRSWWFILLLVLIFWLFNLNYCKNCNESNSQQEKELASAFLPPTEGVNPPIDSLDIGYDEDSLFLIANNRINVALKDKQSEFYSFINKLGETFLNKDREIIYYHEETSRIQIQFNENEGENIKDELRKAAPDFELLIWDESIFVNSFRQNDPYLNEPSKNWYLKSINMEQAWSLTMGSKDIVVAVVDDGFDLNHDELKKANITKKYNVVKQSENVFGNQSLKHGTHVSTILLGASNNNRGLAGIAPQVSFMPIQIGNEQNQYLSSTDIIDGILYALKNKVDVVNLSLGKQFSSQVSMLPENQQKELIQTIGKDEEAFWNELFAIADKQNTTIVIAAGNEGILSGIDPMQRQKNVIIVGASDKGQNLALFSNYGNLNTINAPGVGIVSAVPGNKFEPMDGTSMACPVVAGAIALYKSIKPNATNIEIKRKLISTSQKGKIINVEKFLKS